MMEGQHGLCTGRMLGTGLSCGFVRRRSSQGVVVVVGQPDVGAVSRGFLVMERRRRPQLPPSFLQQRLPRLVVVARVQPIAAGGD